MYCMVFIYNTAFETVCNNVSSLAGRYKMKELKHNKERRTSRQRDLPEPPRKIARRSPSEPSEDEVRHHRKRHNHHREKHSYSPEESKRDSSKSRHERVREYGHEKRRNNHHGREHRPVDNIKVKDERESDEDQYRPSSSKWDDEGDRGARYIIML